MPVPILQSGFVSFKDDRLEKPFIPKNTFNDFVLHKERLKSANPYFFSELITKMHSEWLAEPNVIRNFEFRETLLQEGMRLFHSKSFASWISEQSEKPAVGQLHAEFLMETVNYILTGKRKVDISQWDRLLEANLVTVPVRINMMDYFDGEVNPKKYLNPDITDVFRMWVSYPDGFTDLLLSLNVIFGRRPYITDVLDKNVS